MEVSVSEERRDGRGRWSAKRKAAAILRLLRGEDLETLSRELGVTAATLSGWRDQFLDGGEANLRAREADVENEETQRLKSLVADLSMSRSEEHTSELQSRLHLVCRLLLEKKKNKNNRWDVSHDFQITCL